MKLPKAALQAVLCRDSLPEFVRTAWPHVEPAPLVWSWHLDALANRLQQVERREIDRLLIAVPPGTGKSLTATLFTAWLWTRNPEARILAASYSAHLSKRDQLRVAALVRSPWWRRAFGDLEIGGTQSTMTTGAGGWRIATSIGGVGTGEHPDVAVVDDPLSAEQGASEAERDRAYRWYTQTISTRGISRGMRVVLIGQRLHEDDLHGRLERTGGWTTLRLPMRAESEDRDPLDVREEGALLCPDLLPDDKVRQMEVEIGPYGVAAQFQQRPAPLGGGLFKRAWFELAASPAPKGARRIRAWDTAASEGEGDWTVGLRMAQDGGRFYVEDVRRARLGPQGVNALILDTALDDGRLVGIREEQEPGSAGLAVTEARRRLLVGFDYRPVRVTGDKEVRARPYRAQVEGRNVTLRQAPWTEAYLRELELFPAGAHDDQVDASSCAFNCLADPPARTVRTRWS